MERFALYVNDAQHAAPLVQAMLIERDELSCVVVLCPPRMTQHVGRWLSQRQRVQWRQTWADRARGQLQALLPVDIAKRLNWTVADGALPRTAQRLRREHGAGIRLVDLRRPLAGTLAAPLQDTAATPAPGTAATGWGTGAAVTTGVAAVMTLLD